MENTYAENEESPRLALLTATEEEGAQSFHLALLFPMEILCSSWCYPVHVVTYGPYIFNASLPTTLKGYFFSQAQQYQSDECYRTWKYSSQKGSQKSSPRKPLGFQFLLSLFHNFTSRY